MVACELGLNVLSQKIVEAMGSKDPSAEIHDAAKKVL